MPDVTLPHCVSVVILEPDPPHPHVSALVLTVGGTPLDGVVEVTAGPGELPGVVSVPTGSSGRHPCPGVTTLRLHYQRAPGGPDAIDATYVVEKS